MGNVCGRARATMFTALCEHVGTRVWEHVLDEDEEEDEEQEENGAE